MSHDEDERKHRDVNFLSLVAACDNFPSGPVDDRYYLLYLPGDDQPHGYMLPQVVARMPFTSAFEVNHEVPRCVSVLDQSDGDDIPGAVNAAFQDLINICVEQKTFRALAGMHSEPFAIPSARYEKPVQIERFAAQLFGITHRGAHLVAYTFRDSEMYVWIPRRAAHLFTYPGMLDTTVAGGVKAGASPLRTIIEEAHEEASLPEDLVRRLARCRGTITHMSVSGEESPAEEGLVCPDYTFVYDMELPPDLVPRPNDDEVAGFTAMTVEDLKAAMLREEFKDDSAVVLVDFLIRHGVITPENEPDFVEITMRLHRKLPFRT
ncbi:hypothetical protein B0A48_10733 [Cryoendolithus antarcticus]|uniref:Nudix hydrolase domain-containing protein n=1 Tax=Cryoendolithus antarcticus TaxID=1507870 RepID=A0A1V8SYG8_9PEZI|nr:hypothetical protein B0A48_10733 [Cryoendolithus antarcticus]